MKTTETVKNGRSNQVRGLQIESIELSKISTDPKQPRKTHSEEALQRLANTIEELGLIQPISVRAAGKGKYIIIVGERRYRACKLLKWKHIDCVVKDLDVGIIPEIQIIENLQREDVEPIEEAEGIALLRKKYSVNDLSKRIGRSEKFIRQRTKLADLIPEFKSLAFDNKLILTKAISLANFEEEEQKEIYDGMIQQCQEFNLNYINRACEEMRFDLNKAPFDINDAELLVTAGACGNCPFNSLTQGALFGDDNPVCSKASCYQMKKDKHLLGLLDQAKETNTIIVPNIWNHNIDRDENQLVISYMEENGFTVYLPSDVDIMKLPIKPELEQIKKDNRWKDLTDKEWKDWFKEEMDDYNDKLKDYEAAPNDGYLKGAMLRTQDYTLEEILVKLPEEDAGTLISSISASEKTIAQCTPQEQISKIEKREERKKWIENNKMFKELAGVIKETDYVNLKKALTLDEMMAITIVLLEDYSKYGEFKKAQMKWDEKSRKKNKLDVLADFKPTFKKETLNRAIRNIILQQCHFDENNQTNNIVNASIYNVFKANYPKKVEAIEKVYNAKRKQRTAKLKSRIQGLKAEIKELGS